MAKRITLDFKNNFIIFDLKGQQGTEYHDSMDKDKIMDVLGNPDELEECNNITLDFEQNEIVMNQSVYYDLSSGLLYPDNMIEAEDSFCFPSLSDKYEDIVEALGYEEVDLREDIQNLMIDIALNLNMVD